MTDPTDIREQLAAYLGGELDGPAARALQERIDAEPWVAGLADQMADLLIELGGVDDIDPPAGFGATLRAGLEAEIGHALPPADGATVSPAVGAPSVSTGPRRRRDSARPGAAAGIRLRRTLSVAAVLAVLGLGLASVLTDFGGGDDQAADMADDGGFAGADADIARMTDDDGEHEDQAVEGDAAGGESAALDESALAATAPAGDDEAASDTADAEAAEEAASDAPVVLDLGPVEDDAVVLDAVAGQPVLDALLGQDVAVARELAAAYRDELLRGPDFGDATPAGTCLTETLDAAGDDLVPAVALRLDPPAGPAVAYALVTSRGGTILDGVDVWVLQLDGCGIQQVLRQR